VLYVSHRLDEIFELADRVTVLRNGINVGTHSVDALTKQALVELMLGSEARADYRAVLPPPGSQDVLQVRELSGRFLDQLSFEVRRGEVLGIAGLPVDGRDELPRLLTDESRTATGGTVRLVSKGEGWTRVADWHGAGCVLLPPDRARLGVFAAMSVAENLSLSALDDLGPPWRLDHRRENRFVFDWIRRLDVKTGGPQHLIATLSGGNQQKVLFGRVLSTRPEVLVMCEPTAGVDIGARQAIYELVAAQVRAGLSVIIASSDVGDLQALCTRVLVLRRGRLIRELTGDDIAELELLKAMEGVEEGAAV